MAAGKTPSVSKESCSGGLGSQKDGDHCPGTKKGLLDFPSQEENDINNLWCQFHTFPTKYCSKQTKNM